jgi:hypothetical protein
VSKFYVYTISDLDGVVRYVGMGSGRRCFSWHSKNADINALADAGQTLPPERLKVRTFAYDQIELGRFHRAYQALMAHWRATLPASHFLEVDYEAVVDDLEREARRMLDFLRLPWSETVLRFHQTERPVRTASVNQVRQPIYRSSAGRWRKHAAELQPLLMTLGVPSA